MSIMETEEFKKRKCREAKSNEESVSCLAAEATSSNTRISETGMQDVNNREIVNAETYPSCEQESSTSANGAIKKTATDVKICHKNQIKKYSPKWKVPCRTEFTTEDFCNSVTGKKGQEDTTHPNFFNEFCNISGGNEKAIRKLNNKTNLNQGTAAAADCEESNFAPSTNSTQKSENTAIEIIPMLQELEANNKNDDEVVTICFGDGSSDSENQFTEKLMMQEIKKRLELLFAISDIRTSRPKNHNISPLQLLRCDTAGAIRYVTIATGVIKSILKACNTRLPGRCSDDGGAVSFNFLLNFIRIGNYVQFLCANKQEPKEEDTFDAFFDMQLPELNMYNAKVREIAYKFSPSDIRYAFRRVSCFLNVKQDFKDKIRNLSIIQLKFMAAYGVFIIGILRSSFFERKVRVIEGVLADWFEVHIQDNSDSIAIYVFAAETMIMRFYEDYKTEDSATMALIEAMDNDLLSLYLKSLSKCDKASDTVTNTVKTSSKSKKKHRRKKEKMQAAAAAEAEKARSKAEQVVQPIVLPEVKVKVPKVETKPETSASSAPTKTEEKQLQETDKKTVQRDEVIKKEKKRKGKLNCEPVSDMNKKNIKSQDTQAQAPKPKPVSKKPNNNKKKKQKQGKKAKVKAPNSHKEPRPRDAREPRADCASTRERTLSAVVTHNLDHFNSMMNTCFNDLRALFHQAVNFSTKQNKYVMKAAEIKYMKEEGQALREKIAQQCSELESVIHQTDSADNNSVRAALTDAGVILADIQPNQYLTYRVPISNCKKRAAELDDQLATFIANL